MTIEKGGSNITFTNKDLPPKGINHNKALHLNVEFLWKTITLSLVANGSAVNVMPLRTAQHLGLSLEQYKPSQQTIRAYDNSRRDIIGTIPLSIKTGEVEKNALFHVMDIKPVFNLLLGRPWLHDLQAIPSSLHQKVKFYHNGDLVTIPASNIQVNASVDYDSLGVSQGSILEDIFGFHVACIETEEKNEPEPQVCFKDFQALHQYIGYLHLKINKLEGMVSRIHRQQRESSRTHTSLQHSSRHTSRQQALAITPIGMSYTKALQRLISWELLKPLPPTVDPPHVRNNPK